MSKPGVMIYFDTTPALMRLTLQECGQLFLSILTCAESGVISEYLDSPSVGMGIAWDLIKPSLDRDDKKYEDTCRKKRYATYCRDIKKKLGVPLEFEDWVISVDSNNVGSSDIRCYPTTVLTTSTASASNTISTAITATTSAEAGTSNSTTYEVSGGKSEGGGGNISADTELSLSEYEFEQLRNNRIQMLSGYERGHRSA